MSTIQGLPHLIGRNVDGVDFDAWKTSCEKDVLKSKATADSNHVIALLKICGLCQLIGKILAELRMGLLSKSIARFAVAQIHPSSLPRVDGIVVRIEEGMRSTCHLKSPFSKSLWFVLVAVHLKKVVVQG